MINNQIQFVALKSLIFRQNEYFQKSRFYNSFWVAILYIYLFFGDLLSRGYINTEMQATHIKYVHTSTNTKHTHIHLHKHTNIDGRQKEMKVGVM